jgi:hypothetical protein
MPLPPQTGSRLPAGSRMNYDVTTRNPSPALSGHLVPISEVFEYVECRMYSARQGPCRNAHGHS